jgi:hypothetical protein
VLAAGGVVGWPVGPFLTLGRLQLQRTKFPSCEQPLRTCLTSRPIALPTRRATILGQIPAIDFQPL